MVIRTSLHHDLKSAIMVSLGGCLPELLYASIAITGVTFLNQHPEFLLKINYAVGPVLFLVGIYFLNQKSKKHKHITENRSPSFTKGIILATLNPQLLPFWFGILIYINSIVMVNEISEKIAFITGTAFGAFVLLSFYALLAFKKRDVINQYLVSFNFDKLMGWSLIGLAVLKGISFL